jgi:hypothetical protein
MSDRDDIRSGLWFGFSDFGYTDDEMNVSDRKDDEEPNQCIDPERCGDDCKGSCFLYNYFEEE